MKRSFCTCLIFLIVIILVSCGAPKDAEVAEGGVCITDAFGNECVLRGDARVVSCYGSFSECFLLSGGRLAGVTDDAVNERGLDVGDAVTVGSVKHIDLERIAMLEPDYVILSADLAAHLSLESGLEALGIEFGYFRMDGFDDLKRMMRMFCSLNGDDDAYERYVTAHEARIAEIKAKMPQTDESVLLVRVYSSGLKAKTDDNLAGVILGELGFKNIADEYPSLLEELSFEKIAECDPDRIFAIAMGSEEGARAYLENTLKDPLWKGLGAVKNRRVHMLPKELFHYKPVSRWSESYEYIAKIAAPDLFGEADIDE